MDAQPMLNFGDPFKNLFQLLYFSSQLLFAYHWIIVKYQGLSYAYFITSSQVIQSVFKVILPI